MTQGLSNEATRGTRDDGIRQTGVGRRPTETELAMEEVHCVSKKTSHFVVRSNFNKY